MREKNQRILYYNLGPSDIFVMEMSVISANLTLMIYWEHIKGTFPGINFFYIIS